MRSKAAYWLKIYILFRGKAYVGTLLAKLIEIGKTLQVCGNIMEPKLVVCVGRGGSYILFMNFTIEGMGLCLYRSVRALIGTRRLWRLTVALGGRAASGRKWQWR